MPSSWREAAETELVRAQAARAAGNEGRARVCARRAAGIAARDFLDRHSVRTRSESAYELLNILAGFPGLAPDLRQAAVHLTMRVTEAFSLPLEVDLITEARLLCTGLERIQ
jgi:hypothetical protein